MQPRHVCVLIIWIATLQHTYANDEAIPLRNSLNMSLMYVKSGSFVMGSPYKEEYGQED